MFTGVVAGIGRVTKIVEHGEAITVTISHPYNADSIALGASIACSGVCLTVVAKTADSFNVDISRATLFCTTLKNWQVGSKINLERSLHMGDEMGGHIVTGHVDGVGTILELTQQDKSHIISFSVPDAIKYYIAAKGSVAVDGVSLTVNAVDDNQFKVNIIPYTYEHTIFHDLAINSQVNIEIDILARYTARMAQKYTSNHEEV